MSILDTIAGTARAGTLHGVGVGPGDVRLLTLRAAGIIMTADVIAYFHKRDCASNSRTIVAPLIRAGQIEMALEYPVTIEAPVSAPQYVQPMSRFYEDARASIATHLDAGRSVALLAEGDPFFYGSFMHIWRRMKDDAAVEVIPGVTGMAGAWSNAGAPITWGDDALAVLPGTLDEAALTRRLRETDAAVVMKIGRHLGKIKRAMSEAGCLERAIYVERGTMAAERILPLVEMREELAPYFSLILVPGRGRQL